MILGCCQSLPSSLWLTLQLCFGETVFGRVSQPPCVVVKPLAELCRWVHSSLLIDGTTHTHTHTHTHTYTHTHVWTQEKPTHESLSFSDSRLLPVFPVVILTNIPMARPH